MSEQPYIYDISGAADFNLRVIEASFEKPVLVDFWAEWCAPCKALLPVLTQIAEDYRGELCLARVNCDLEQEVVMRFGIRSLPTVVLFKAGQPVDGFAGAQPESAIRALLQPHVSEPEALPTDPLETAQSLFDAGQAQAAEAQLKALLTEDNQNARALILYARCLAERGELADAQAVLDSVQGDDHKEARNAARAQLTFLRQAQELPDSATLQARLRENPDDDEASYQLSIQWLAQQGYEAALEALLALFIRRRDYAEGAAHKTLLQVFDLLGPEHPLVKQFRRRLYQALY